jgi:hypothetical protein
MPNLAMSIDTLMMSDRLLADALQIDSRLRHNRAHIIQPILCINSMKFSMIFCSVISGTSEYYEYFFFPSYQTFFLAGHRSRVPDVT